jgi:hypothetical protein
MRDAGARRRLSTSGRRLVDGEGAFRVAKRIRELSVGRTRSVHALSGAVDA